MFCSRCMKREQVWDEIIRIYSQPKMLELLKKYYPVPRENVEVKLMPPPIYPPMLDLNFKKRP